MKGMRRRFIRSQNSCVTTQAAELVFDRRCQQINQNAHEKSAAQIDEIPSITYAADCRPERE